MHVCFSVVSLASAQIVGSRQYQRYGVFMLQYAIFFSNYFSQNWDNGLMWLLNSGYDVYVHSKKMGYLLKLIIAGILKSM